MDIGASPTYPIEELLRRLHVEVMSSRRLRIGEEWHFDLCSPFWRLYVNNRSGAYITHSGRRYLLEAGRICLVPAWCRFQTGLSREVTQDFLHFRVAGLPTVLRPFLLKPLFPEAHPAIDALYREWSKELDEPPGVSHICWAASLAHAALGRAFEEFSRGDGPSMMHWVDEGDELRPALDCLDRQFAHPPSNADLARLCHLSEDHFIRRFRRAIGSTPARYSRERRIAAAAEWLTGTARTLDDIAEAAGFTDRFHFSRVFQRQLGLPPGRYRRMHGKESAFGAIRLGDALANSAVS